MRRRVCSQLFGLIFVVSSAFFVSTDVGAQLSVGSKWTRSSGAFSQNQRFVGGNFTFQTVTGGFRASPGTVFGGVTVGRGFLPFYYPGYYAPYGSYPCPGFLTPYGLTGHVGPLVVGGLRSDFYSDPAAVRFYNEFGLPASSPYFGQDLQGTSSSFEVPDSAPVNRFQPMEVPSVDLGPAFAKPDSLTTLQRGNYAANDTSFADPVDAAPLPAEFTAAAIREKPTTALDEVESLRLQTAGDQAFRSMDTELARTYYQAAIQAMPNRQSAWLRMAWIHVFQDNFSHAAAAFNRALLVDNNTGWIAADTLLQGAGARELVNVRRQLLAWLNSRPASADRLLLTAAFQYFIGDESSADNLMALAQSAGLSAARSDALVATVEQTAGMQDSDEANAESQAEAGADNQLPNSELSDTELSNEPERAASDSVELPLRLPPAYSP